MVRFYWVPIYHHQGLVIVPQLSGDEVLVNFVFQDLDGSAGDIIDDAYSGHSHARSSKKMKGTPIDLHDIVGWAIENGYLDQFRHLRQDGMDE